MRLSALLSILIGLSAASQVSAWDAHDHVTRLALQSQENWDEVAYEPIENALPALAVGGKPAPRHVEALAHRLGIHAKKINWTWQPSAQDLAYPAALEVIAYGALEADAGMDQDHDLSEDQKYMGGTKGPSSQGFRHMYYRKFDVAEPLATFHFPFREMGGAPERAQLYFDLAVQAKKGGHLFWAYRFLGWGVHYVQDIGQPFHANQLGSITLFPLWTLISRGFEAGVAEATRLSGNFHLSFEQYTNYFLSPSQGSSPLLVAFKIPKGDEVLRKLFEQNMKISIEGGVKALAISSSHLAAQVVAAQQKLMGKALRDPSMDIIAGFYDKQGKPKIDFNLIEADPSVDEQRKAMHDAMFQALSNTGVATRWYVDRFRIAK